MAPDLLIELENVKKYYEMGEETVKAVDGISVKIEKGDFVAIMGPSGSGKCITGDSLILNSGMPIQIKELEHKQEPTVLALDNNDFKIKTFNITNFYKREVKKVLEVKTNSGKKISVTEEHPFFTLDEDGFTEIQAKNLKSRTFIATARKIKIEGKKQYLNSIENLGLDKSLIIANSKELVKKISKKLKFSRADICRKFNILNGTYDSWRTKNNISLFNFKRIIEMYGGNIKEHEENIKLTALSSPKTVKIPPHTSPELLEFYGFLAGDGNLDKDGIKITNLDEKIRKRIIYLSEKLFELTPRQSAKRLDINTRVLIAFFNKIFNVPLIKKSNSIKLPDFIFKCSDEEIAGFIKGLFDCDSYVSNSKKEINIILASKELINQLSVLFLRFGIVSRYSERMKYVSGRKQQTLKKYYSLSISGHDNLVAYKKNIGFNSNFKSLRLEKLLQTKANTNVDVIPCGKLVKKIRQESGIVLPRAVHKKLWAYEYEKIHPSKNKLEKLIELLEKYNIDASKLKILTQSDIFWDKIISIRELRNKTLVYDITVPTANNFISNGFIIHNSTAMNLVGSLDLATEGDIFLDGKDIEHLGESELAQIRGKKIGFIFQSFNLINNLTAKENVMLPMLFQGTDKSDREEKAEKLLKLVELSDRMDHYPNQLSGGQQQRVAIARSLANDPEVILADEPTGNLDTKTGNLVMEFLEKMNKQGKTIIMVTHDPDKALNHAKTIYWLVDGKVDKVTKKVHGSWKTLMHDKSIKHKKDKEDKAKT
jgi:putative ABC transport system ATP-binding protein